MVDLEWNAMGYFSCRDVEQPRSYSDGERARGGRTTAWAPTGIAIFVEVCSHCFNLRKWRTGSW
ncbi:hypothetical protein CC1G_14530 [Coprinopsis cinerea okayama7|uniref:Uncharacterized protein n=1 Tax=Coprinopsis cinerea (strain Okayama-7 / 130 / ATCC MYA-4618 / FGSC 9003) TaxID=240176 RepID=D6RMX8_COPC7|nr:hypothetical protein CC1G_14530 [Coprinopsis cinerea okayama7\|eukprot:XP_002911098.1 hypothetical protein CC1G_14530 [Coprinopsis cinerea okayama7\